ECGPTPAMAAARSMLVRRLHRLAVSQAVAGVELDGAVVPQQPLRQADRDVVGVLRDLRNPRVGAKPANLAHVMVEVHGGAARALEAIGALHAPHGPKRESTLIGASVAQHGESIMEAGGVIRLADRAPRLVAVPIECEERGRGCDDQSGCAET